MNKKERTAHDGDSASHERIVACVHCGEVLGFYLPGDRIPDGPHECPCPACEGEGWVWEYLGAEPMKAPCPQCAGRLEIPTEEEINRMGADHVA